MVPIQWTSSEHPPTEHPLPEQTPSDHPPRLHPLPERPCVSIVLPIRNEEPHIRACLERLLAQDYPPTRLEILIVDGASTDATRDVVRAVIDEHPHRVVRLLDNPKRIVPPALNTGIRAARGDVIVRMDGHTVPAPDYVSACVRALRSSGAANAGGRIRPVGNTSFGEAVAVAQSHPVGAGDAKFHWAAAPQFVDTVYLGAFRKEIFESTGLFDESMVRNQDYEMNVRIRNAGGAIYLDPSIRSDYTPRGSLRSLWTQYFEYGWWRVATWRRHPASLRWRQALPAAFVAALAALSVAAPFLAAARVMLAVQMLAYVLVLAAATLHARDRLGRPVVLALFPVAVATLHAAFGTGFLLHLATAGRYPFRARPPAIPRLRPESAESPRSPA